jgi:hypothetical protein
MKRLKKKQTDDEIEAEVLATRIDPSRWDPLPAVPPSRSPRPDWMLRKRNHSRGS